MEMGYVLYAKMTQTFSVVRKRRIGVSLYDYPEDVSPQWKAKVKGQTAITICVICTFQKIICQSIFWT